MFFNDESPTARAAEFATRPRHPNPQPAPRVLADTRLWAALQNASGGSWGGCIYDAEKIIAQLERGRVGS